MGLTQDQLALRKGYRTVVGTYGCPQMQRVVRVRPPRGFYRNKPSSTTHFRLLCPCGETHYRQPTWRWATPYEREQAEITLRSEDVVQ